MRLLEDLPILLRESAYHRDFDAEEELPGYVLWRVDQEEEGMVDLNVAFGRAALPE